MAIVHSTAADGSFSSTGATAWNADHNIVEAGSSAALTLGTIGDGQFIKRSGTSLIGATVNRFVKKQGNTATNATTTLTTASGCQFALVSGNTYNFTYRIFWKVGTAATNTTCGLSLGLTFPAATMVAARAEIMAQAANGTDSSIIGQIIAASSAVTSTTCQTPATTSYATVTGTITPSANGNLSLLYASEIATTAGVIIMSGTNGVIEIVQ